MRIGTMLGDLARSLFRRPATRRYPRERPAVSERLRGALRWNPARCTGCGMCVRDCPANAIELITLDKASKRFVLRYHLDRCTFCGQCVQTCNFGCLELANDRWELAALSTEPFTVHYGDETDIQTVLAGGARTDDRTPERG
jgi:formate hydrogenlyase subunit 6/NADH:ubiquinone oxidoreductase subunit I